ncbi:hypothetical protein J7E95_32650, partial [Streptomyces sp. ISL-14]|nr:hypothetical protein [Streptomyces sp. ISL-14]
PRAPRLPAPGSRLPAPGPRPPAPGPRPPAPGPTICGGTYADRAGTGRRQTRSPGRGRSVLGGERSKTP